MRMLILISSILLLSCQRQEILNSLQPSSFSVTVDNAPKQFTQSSAAKVKGPGARNTYQIVASKGTEVYFAITILTDSLRPGTYLIKPDNVANYRDGLLVGTNLNNQVLNLVLASHSNGKIVGTFSGTLLNQTAGGNMTLKDGTFSIPISYIP